LGNLPRFGASVLITLILRTVATAVRAAKQSLVRQQDQAFPHQTNTPKLRHMQTTAKK
jgi:hypothetical protein